MNRVLLLLAHRENRRLLAQWLEGRYAVLVPGNGAGLEQVFDLALVDGPALERLGEWVRAVRRAESPIFLPFLLVTHRRDVGLATRHLWESVDDLVVSPVEKAELQARVEAMMRARQLSVENASLARQLEAELTRAGRVQSEMLPQTVPRLPGFDLAGRCVPAREVGGDFYDWQETRPGTLTLSLGDVMGKGMPAALLMATVRATLRAASAQNPPGDAVERVRQALDSDLRRTDSFVTVFHAHLDAAQRRVTYVAAGHGCAARIRPGGEAELVDRTGPPLGVTGAPCCRECSFVLGRGEMLVIYSDGLLETTPELATDPAAVGRNLRDASSAAEAVRLLLGDAGDGGDGGGGAVPDDLTVVALRCEP